MSGEAATVTSAGGEEEEGRYRPPSWLLNYLLIGLAGARSVERWPDGPMQRHKVTISREPKDDQCQQLLADERLDCSGSCVCGHKACWKGDSGSNQRRQTRDTGGRQRRGQ